MLVVGDKEVESATVSIRRRSGEQLAGQSPDSFKRKIKKAIASKANEIRG